MKAEGFALLVLHCLSAYSIHRYGEPIAHVHCKLKSRLLLSNRCHVEYCDLALSLSLNSWLTKSLALFVVLEGNLCSELTAIG